MVEEAPHERTRTRVWLRLVAPVVGVAALVVGALMNLVAKEFVMAREEDGVLILSDLAGAARELTDALLVNPYHVDEFAHAIRHAVEMPLAERDFIAGTTAALPRPRAEDRVVRAERTVV